MSSQQACARILINCKKKIARHNIKCKIASATNRPLGLLNFDIFFLVLVIILVLALRFARTRSKSFSVDVYCLVKFYNVSHILFDIQIKVKQTLIWCVLSREKTWAGTRRHIHSIITRSSSLCYARLWCNIQTEKRRTKQKVISRSCEQYVIAGERNFSRHSLRCS